MNKIAIYTCSVGGYDHLYQPLAVDSRFDYVCFTDRMEQETDGVWQMRSIPFYHKTPSRLSRYPKLLPHLVLPEYEYSVYMDANLQIVDQEFYHRILKIIEDGCLVAQVKHAIPPVDCIYDEIAYAYLRTKTTLKDALCQAFYLKAHRFPKHYGLFENNIIFRKHLDERVVNISNQWWTEYINHSPRDQFSLMYVYWKNNYMPELLFGEDVCARNCNHIDYHSHLNELEEFSFFTKVKIKFHIITYPIVKMFI